MAKKKFKIINWYVYNKSLVNRGSLTFWLDELAIQDWYDDPKTTLRGRPQRYLELAISTVLLLKRVFRLTLRAEQEFIVSIFILMKLPLRCPNYSFVSRRAKSVIAQFFTGLNRPKNPSACAAPYIRIRRRRNAIGPEEVTGLPE